MLRPSRLLRYAQAAVNDFNWAVTLNLPKTSFPARTPPEDFEKHQTRSTQELYQWQRENRPAKDEQGEDNTFVLHDGPPYANGPVHVGHAVNKVLKDLILRTNLSRGKQVRYRPGWDCHGLPIELKALRDVGDAVANSSPKKNDPVGEKTKDSGAIPHVDPISIRAQARRLALKTVDQQSKSFQSWAVMGDWANPYLTMDKDFELRQLGVFRAMVAKGLIYRQNKPVHWSPSSMTALAEAELEYDDKHKVTAAYIRFPITNLCPLLQSDSRVHPDKLSALIWTTTPWTLPANTAIGIRSDLVYSLIEVLDHGQMLVAKDRVPDVLSRLDGASPDIVIDEIEGSALLDGPMEYVNVLSGKTSRFIHVDFVTATTGTGLVHLSAGHGMEDYLALRAQGFHDAFAPVDDQGKFTSDALPDDPGRLQGLYVESKGTKAVLDILRERPSSLPVKAHNGQSLVLSTENLLHRNPIDWRTKEPVIVRATHQWFADVGSIQEDAIRSLEGVTFLPETGATRLQSFLRGRSQWCISRQRSWGVPIPALYRKDTGEAVMTVDSIEHIIAVIAERGSDAWWSDPADDKAWIPSSLPPADYIRGTDTMDVWFDSGTSWTTLDSRDDPPVADVYVEGTDQHRGWFQSSMLTMVASQSYSDMPDPPFATLITHGFTLDSKGHKMSKSLGNVVTPDEILRGVLNTPTKKTKAKSKADAITLDSPTDRKSALGPDALRLWVASSDYTKDISISQPALLAIHQALAKYRTTFKYLLGVTSEYPFADANTDLLSWMGFADQALIMALTKTSSKVFALQNDYDFARSISVINAFINQDLSATYLEVAKDRLYAGSVETSLHTQTILMYVLDQLVFMLAPICPLLIDEVWKHSPAIRKEGREHFLRRVWVEPFQMETEDGDDMSEEESSDMEKGVTWVRRIGEAVKGAQEEARQQGKLGSGLACQVEVLIPKPVEESFLALLSLLQKSNELHELLGTSGTTILPLDVDERREIRIIQEKNEEYGEEARAVGRWRDQVEWEVERGFVIGVDENGQEVKGSVKVMPSMGKKCERCWKWAVVQTKEQVEQGMPSLCLRCEELLGKALQEHESSGKGKRKGMDEGDEGDEDEDEDDDNDDDDDDYSRRWGGTWLREKRRRKWRSKFGLRR